MFELDLINTVITSTAIVFGITFVMLFFRRYESRQKAQHELERERLRLQMELETKKQEAEEDRAYKENEIQEERARIERERFEDEMINSGRGGYIILDMAESQRLLFHDLLKGFEEYAKIRGYSVSFSIDSSQKDKIAFKFTIQDAGISISTQRVRNDFAEYLKKIKTGSDFDNLPIVISEEEHNLLLTTLKNRFAFLETNYKIQKNAITFYENLLFNVNYTKRGFLPSPSVVVQTGGTMDSRNYNSQNSSHLIQGDQNSLVDKSSNSSINIANSFNKKKEQIDHLSRLAELLRKEDDGEEERTKAIVNLEKVKDELEESENPEPGLIKKWLEKAKGLIGLISIGKETADSAVELWNSFGL